MTSPAKVNLKIYQGSTFLETFRWESSTKGYVPITNIDKSAPVLITTASHQIPVGWRVKITGAGGMKEINSTEEYHTVTETTDTTLVLNNINATQFTTYTSGGIVEYNIPVYLGYYTARMQLRPSLKSDTVIDTYTTENGYLIIDETYNTISINVPPDITETYTFSSAVYSLELIDSQDSSVTTFIEGLIVLEKEVTR